MPGGLQHEAVFISESEIGPTGSLRPPPVQFKRSRLFSCDRATVRPRGRARIRDIIFHRLHEGAIEDSVASAPQTDILKRRQRSASSPLGESRRLRPRLITMEVCPVQIVTMSVIPPTRDALSAPVYSPTGHTRRNRCLRNGGAYGRSHLTCTLPSGHAASPVSASAEVPCGS